METFVRSRKISFLFVILVLVVVLLNGTSFNAVEDNARKNLRVLSQPSDYLNRTLININNISMWIYADGTSANTPAGNPGAIFPRGTAGVIFQDGIVWGGQVRDGKEPVIRTGGQRYSIGTVPGRIISKGVAEDFSNPTVDRIWRIRRDYLFADLREDAAELNLKSVEEVTDGEIEAVRARYEADWIEWPWEKGAPFYDSEGDGVYSPQFHSDGTPKLFPEADEPGLVDADQVVWLVANDLDSLSVKTFAGSPSIGLEMQITLWGYRNAGALDNVIFKNVRIIYNGTENTPADARIDSMYLAQWSDPDVGGAGDDFVGCDTLLDLGYGYNASTQDAVFEMFSLPPPAVGYDILAGPIVPSSGSEAVFGVERLFEFRNLPMTAFVFEGSTNFDPPLSTDYVWTLWGWNQLRGFRLRPASPPQPWIDPNGNPTKFVFPGDPVTIVGWIDFSPGDRRMSLASGPFTMALGDTNEINIALIGGIASDRLRSISALKYTDEIAQSAFDYLFELSEPPQIPSLTATELDGDILLNWSKSQAEVEIVERDGRIGYKFEGYNVYQLPSVDAGLDDGLKLATFDRINDVDTIVQERFDPQIGLVVPFLAQEGANSGIVRSIRVGEDALNGIPLINGREYFFAVTAYNYNPDKPFGIVSLESEPAVVSVVPHALNPGVRLETAMGDTIAVEHNRGKSEGQVIPIVIDPVNITGDTYEVTFQKSDEGGTVWSLTNTTKGETLLVDQANQSGDNNYLITDGLQVKVLGPPLDFKRFAIVSNGNGPITETFGFEVTPPPTTYTGYSVDWYRDVLLSANGGVLGFGGPHGVTANGGFYFFVAGSASVTNHETARVRILQNDNAARAIGNDYEMRWTEEGGVGLMAFTSGTCVDVPFELWYLGPSTLEETSDDVRMLPRIFDDNENDMFDFKLDHAASGGENDPYTDWVYYMMPGNDSPGDAGYQAYATAGCDESAAGGVTEHLARTVIMNWNQFAGGGGENVFPEPGVTIRIEMSKINSPNDVFTFSTAVYGPRFSKEQAREDIRAINVFPNPYYGLFRVDIRSSDRWVTFSHLPERANIRIFNLAGILVRTIRKDNVSQFERWDLLNERGRIVAGGIYIAHIEMPELGVSKILKLAVFHR